MKACAVCMCDTRFVLSGWDVCSRSGGHGGGTRDWFDVVERRERLWILGLSTGAGELEGQLHKLFAVGWSLIEKSGEGTGPLICGPRLPFPVTSGSSLSELGICLQFKE